MTGLPAYTGPDGTCPRCGVAGAMTEWHRAALLASPDMAGRMPPCAEHAELELAALGGAGGHLCRVCLNCGYGWAEACVGRPAQERAAVHAAWAGLLALAAGAACTGARNLLGQEFSGPELAAMWLAVTVVVALIAAIGQAVLAGPVPGVTADSTLRRTGERHHRDRVD
jgi:hypothetical protein